MTALVYQGQAIRRQGEMLSLTDMWRAAGEPAEQRPADWSSKAGSPFIAFLSEALNAAPGGILRTERGRNGGTWGHWQVAIAYAKDLSHAFHAWCNDVVRAHMEGLQAPPTPSVEESNLLRAEEHKLNLVARMQAMKGPAYAFALYRRLGLPVAEPELRELEAETSPARTFTAEDVAETLRAFLRERAAGIVPIAAAGATSTWNRRGIVGFRHGSGDILLPRETWDVVMAAYDARNAARTLAVAGHLMKDATNRLCVVARINGKPMRVYRIRAGLLADA